MPVPSPLPFRDLMVDLLVRYGFQVLGALVILLAGVLVAGWVGRLLGRWLEGQRLEPPVRNLLVRTARVLVLAVALLVALDKFGFQIAPLVAGLGVAGLGLGIALQGVLSNLMAGLTIIITKPYRVGEHVSLLGVHGDVSQIELFTTTLIHPDRSRVVIPNRKIVGEILHNFGTIRQLDLSVRVAYAADLSHALRLARDVVAANTRALAEPPPVIGIAALGDSAVTLAVRPWVPVADYVAAQAEIYQVLVERFRAQGVAIPPPQREVRLVGAA
jgi:small conductance mechanosensitive channel